MDTKTFAKKILVFQKSLWNRTQFVRLSPLVKKLEDSPDFPASDGTSRQHLNLGLDGSRETTHLLSEILDATHINILDIKDLQTNSKLELELLKKFDASGSDKGSRHGYYIIYSKILSKRINALNILEFGIGSNNRDTISNMGKNGKPGASLLTFRDIREGNFIVGADIDERILFSKPNIETHKLDQTKDNEWQLFLNKMGMRKFDLIIDDGLHAPFANLRTLKYGINQLIKSDGSIVIEDISHSAIPLWKIIAHTAPKNWKCTIIKCFKSHAFLIELS